MIAYYPALVALHSALNDAARDAQLEAVYDLDGDGGIWSERATRALLLADEALRASADGYRTEGADEELCESAEFLLREIGHPRPAAHWDLVRDFSPREGDDPIDLANRVRQIIWRAEGLDAQALPPLGLESLAHDMLTADGEPQRATLGDPDRDGCLTVDSRDAVTVWAAGSPLWVGPIAGASKAVGLA